MPLKIHPWKLIRKINFHLFLGLILKFKNLHCSETKVPRRHFFIDLNSQSIIHLSPYLILFTPVFSKIWALVKSDCFAITCFSLIHFPCLLVLNLVILSTVFFIIQWSLKSSFDISKVHIPSFNNFVYCFSSVVRSFLLAMFQYKLWTQKNFFVRFQRS